MGNRRSRDPKVVCMESKDITSTVRSPTALGMRGSREETSFPFWSPAQLPVKFLGLARSLNLQELWNLTTMTPFKLKKKKKSTI